MVVSSAYKKNDFSFAIFFLFLVEMAFMISDYKVLCNKVSAAISLILLVAFLAKCVFCGLKKVDLAFIICLVLFTFYYFLSAIVYTKELSEIVEELLYYLIEFSPLFFFFYLRKHSSYRGKRMLIVSFFLIWNVFSIISLFYFHNRPDLARDMAANRNHYYDLVIGGGYPMGYGSAILSVFVLEMIMNKKIRGRMLFFSIAEIVLMTFLVIETHSFIILVSEIFGLLACLIFCRAKKKLQKITLILPLLVFFAFLIIVQGQKIMLFLMDNINDSFFESRVSELYNYLYLDSVNYHINARSSVYSTSLNAFLSNPLFGVGDSSGDHSTILDTLAQFGIFGSIPFFFFCFYPLLKNIEQKRTSFYLIPFAIMLLLNPVFSCFHIMLILYLIIPSAQDFFDNKYENAVCNR